MKRRSALLISLLASSLGGCGGDGAPGTGGAGEAGASGQDRPPSCGAEPSFFVTEVVAHEWGTGQAVGRDDFPALLLGPPRGGGASSGSMHVVSLGEEGTVTVGFGGNSIVDGEGPDFIVFENPFLVSGNSDEPYAELAQVSVSQDGETWLSFPCEQTEYPYGSCAGWHPVFANAEENQISPRNPQEAGGDPFDLADVDLAWARYVRITDRADEQGAAFDLDAVALVHAFCE